MQLTDMHPRAGLYYWAGPGTIRMTKLKFFDPPQNEQELLQAYEQPVLEAFRDRLNISDVWVTFSWGFSDATEAEDRTWLRSTLPNFRRAGLRTHAYVQGLNVVTNEHDTNLLARDRNGQAIPYHRGRHLTCPLNPAARQLLLGRVEAACQEDVDGVFVDNFFFGKFPLPGLGLTPFFGCACRHCRAAFWTDQPPSWLSLAGQKTAEYIAFRCRVMAELSQEIAAICKKYGKYYGCNGLDLDLEPRLFFGYELPSLVKNQDYLLVENFNHPSKGRTNAHLSPLISQSPIPIGIVSYQQAIGRHRRSEQADLDAVFSDATHHGYVPIYKGSEFCTDGTWHLLAPDHLRPPRLLPLAALPPPIILPKRRLQAALRLIAGRYQIPLQNFVYESAFARATLGRLVDRATERAGSLLSSSEKAWLQLDSAE